jgi:hypothetical protein
MSRTTLNEPTPATRKDDLKYLEEEGRMIAVELVEAARCGDEIEDPFVKLENLDKVYSRISGAASKGSPTDFDFNERANYITKAVLREIDSLLKREELLQGSQAAFDLAQNVRELYFSSSSNISAQASPIHIIPEIALLCQNPIVQSTFGQNLVGNLSLSLHFSSAENAFECGREAAEILDNSATSLAEKLDMAAQLKTIVAESYNTWSSYTAEFAEGIISEMSQRDRRPILSYALQSLQQFITRERNEPSLSLVRPSIGAFEYVRSDIVTKDEIDRDRSLRSQLVLDVPGRPQKIAEDAYVIVDQSNTGTHVGVIPKSMKLPEPSYDAYMLSLLKEELQNTLPENFPEKSEYPPHSGWLAVLCSLKGSN